jgi:hypothetical protein
MDQKSLQREGLHDPITKETISRKRQRDATINGNQHCSRLDVVSVQRSRGIEATNSDMDEANYFG